MPITHSAAKAIRRDIHRTQENRVTRHELKKTLDAFKAKPSAQTLSQGYRYIDRAAKKNIIHKNKAARLKSQLAKKLATPVIPSVTKKAVTKKVKAVVKAKTSSTK